MANSPSLTNYLQSRDADFVGGANSFTNPMKLSPVQYQWGENVVNEGRDVGTRWGFINLLKFACGRAQGFKLFQPTNTTIPNMYIAISGEIWVSRYPFNTATRLQGIQFRPDLDFVTFQEAIVTNTPTQAVAPYKVLIMQDGITRAAYTDGTISRHLDPTPNGFYTPFSIGGRETRIGLAMEFVGLRLWVASGRELFASDVGDPLHFIETTYLAGGGSFQAYDGNDITCLKRTADGKQLLIGTAGNTTVLDAGNTTRSTWATSENFERLLFPGVGWVGPKCADDMNGEVFWMSKEGMRFYNAEGQDRFSARRAIASHEMQRSFENRAPVMSRCCAGAFEAYGLMGFPSGDQYNRHIWAINTSDNDLLTEKAPYAWQPIWKGIRPVELDSGNVNGMNRMFCLEQGRDIPRVWELFAEKRRDYYMLGGVLNENPIQCRLETRGHNFGQLQSFSTFAYSDLFVKRLFGEVSLVARFKNEYGCYRDYGAWNLCTEQCVTIEQDDEGCHFSGAQQQQHRYLKSKEPDPSTCGDGGAPFLANVGTYFTFELTWTGEMFLMGMNHFARQFIEKTKGACQTGDAACVELACCNEELDYWSAPEEFFPSYYYSSDCIVMEVTDE